MPRRTKSGWAPGELKRLQALWRYLDAGRAYLGEVHAKLPEGMTGVVMVNQDRGLYFHAESKDAGWAEARRRWGPNIAHPPLWMIELPKATDKVTTGRS